jgi:hypothetical protein
MLPPEHIELADVAMRCALSETLHDFPKFREVISEAHWSAAFKTHLGYHGLDWAYDESRPFAFLVVNDQLVPDGTLRIVGMKNYQLAAIAASKVGPVTWKAGVVDYGDASPR